MMNVLVTGGSGFIGSHVAARLQAGGATVIIPTRCLDNAWRLDDPKRFTWAVGDIGQEDFLRPLFEKYRPQAVVHAAWGGMTQDKRDSASQAEHLSNTNTLLRCCADFKITTFVGFGSQAEYGVHNKLIDEETPTQPVNLYGIYKLAAGHLGQWYAREYGFNYAWLRLFSSFGPKDVENYLIPYAIRSFLTGQAPRFGSCQQQWDYLYVHDIARWVKAIVTAPKRFCGIYNLSSGNPVLLSGVVKELACLCAWPGEVAFGALPARPDGLNFLAGDNAKLRRDFSLDGLTPMQDAMAETVAWYKQYASEGAHGQS